MTASGTAGHGDELGGLLPPRRAGRGGGQVVVGRAWPGNPAPRVHPTAAGMLNSVGLQGPGLEAWLERRPAPSGRGRGPGGGQHLGSAGRRTSPRRRPMLAGVRRPHRRGGQRELPQPRGPPADVRPLAARPPPRWSPRWPNTARAAAVGQAESQRGRRRRGGRRRAGGRGRGGHPDQHRRWPWPSTSTAADRSSVRARPAEACPARPSTRWRCGPCSTCAPPIPGPPSSAWAG